MQGTEFLELHSILTEIMAEPLGGAPPIPLFVTDIETRAKSPDGDAPVSEEALRWLELLNRGVDPHLLRQALQKRKKDQAEVQALIRFLVSKKTHSQADREKVDWLVTYLFEVWEERDRDPGGRFDTEIEQILEGCDFPPLSPHGEELLLEIPVLLDELRFFERFSQITESRIIHRGRNLKNQFEEEFFHPTVLAAIVNYNLVLGRKMRGLLHETMQAISRSAPGASAALPNTQEVLQSDYRVISEFLQQVTELEREAQREREQKREKAAPEPLTTEKLAAARAAAAKPPSMEEQLIALGIDPGRQAEQLRNRVKEIALRVKSSPGGAPLPSGGGGLILSDWESKAFLTEYSPAEESFRADFARAVTSVIGIITRIEEELPAYFETRGAEHLWKRHCDALVYLLYEGRRQLEILKKLSADSDKRGLKEKSTQLLATAEKFDSYVKRVAALF